MLTMVYRLRELGIRSSSKAMSGGLLRRASERLSVMHRLRFRELSRSLIRVPLDLNTLVQLTTLLIFKMPYSMHLKVHLGL